MIKLSFYDENLDVIEKGEFSIYELDILLNERILNSQCSFDDMETMLSQTHFCLYRDDKDFLSVDVLNENLFSIESDRLYYPDNLFVRIRNLFRHKSYLSGKVDLKTVKQICQDYMTLDRQTFEDKCQVFYSY